MQVTVGMEIVLAHCHLLEGGEQNSCQLRGGRHGGKQLVSGTIVLLLIVLTYYFLSRSVQNHSCRAGTRSMVCA